MGFGTVILPYLSVTAVASTIGLFLCGLEICAKIRRRGSTDGTGGAPFLIGFISCVFWLQYGFVIADRTVIFNNIVGLTLYTGYLSYYYIKTRNKASWSIFHWTTQRNMPDKNENDNNCTTSCSKLMTFAIENYYLNRIIFLELICGAFAIYGVNHMELEDGGKSWLGTVCILLNIATIGAPLFQIGEVFRTKSSESLPLPLCLASFAVSVQWLAYGIIVEDFVIQMPNYIATFLSIVQLSLFVIYPANGARHGDKVYEKMKEDYDKYENNNDIRLDI
ncbi:hypothetical protein WR25_07692 [Diploscapter pachys]|uniref:Sugar transporter SWEET n=1 Tax=Diploscapter pachys TaxID=2018661 RepID=A0A2A2JP88_9BILA|nr:hypothetical protein WR25_07692 [Diploscapter pachys]